MQASLFVGAGVDKIRLTGGEPTLRPDLVSIVRQLHALPGHPAIGLTSNGMALRRSLQDLQSAGAIAMWSSIAPRVHPHMRRMAPPTSTMLCRACAHAFQQMWCLLVCI